MTHPHLMRMAHETRESYYVAILDNNEVIIIDRADTPEIWRMVARLGQRSPVHATASGQVLMAEAPDELLNAAIQRTGLKRFTPQTITSVTRLKNRLKEFGRTATSSMMPVQARSLCDCHSFARSLRQSRCGAHDRTAIRTGPAQQDTGDVDCRNPQAGGIGHFQRTRLPGAAIMNAPNDLALGIVSDEIAADFPTALRHGVQWGITRYELRCLVSGRVPRVEPREIDGVAVLAKQEGVRITALSPGMFKAHLSDSATIRRTPHCASGNARSCRPFGLPFDHRLRISAGGRRSRRSVPSPPLATCAAPPGTGAQGRHPHCHRKRTGILVRHRKKHPRIDYRGWTSVAWCELGSLQCLWNG